jgi:hypothetical protein
MKINKKLNHYIIIYYYFDKIAKFKTKSIRTWFWPLIIYVINFPYSLSVSYHISRKLERHVTSRTFVRRERDKKQKLSSLHRSLPHLCHNMNNKVPHPVLHSRSSVNVIHSIVSHPSVAMRNVPEIVGNCEHLDRTFIHQRPGKNFKF